MSKQWSTVSCTRFRSQRDSYECLPVTVCRRTYVGRAFTCRNGNTTELCNIKGQWLERLWWTKVWLRSSEEKRQIQPWVFVKAASAEILIPNAVEEDINYKCFLVAYIFVFIAAWRENYMTNQNLPFISLSFASVAAAHRLKSCCTLRLISSSIWSQIAVGCDSSRWCSCILNSTRTSATQHTIDSSNPDTPHRLTSDILLFVSEMRLSCFILLKGFHTRISLCSLTR